MDFTSAAQRRRHGSGVIEVRPLVMRHAGMEKRGHPFEMTCGIKGISVEQAKLAIVTIFAQQAIDMAFGKGRFQRNLGNCQ